MPALTMDSHPGDTRASIWRQLAVEPRDPTGLRAWSSRQAPRRPRSIASDGGLRFGRDEMASHGLFPPDDGMLVVPSVAANMSRRTTGSDAWLTERRRAQSPVARA